MRSLRLLLLALVLAAAPALAQDTNTTGDAGGEAPPAAAEPVVVELEGHAEGSSFYFTRAGATERNPTLTLPPSTEVTIRLTSVSGFHNVQVTDQPASEYAEAGNTIEYTFTTPASGNLEYWCVPHKGSGMLGQIRLAEGGAAPGGGDEPAPEAPTEYTLVGHQEGGAFYWTFPDSSERNPVLLVPAGATITLTITSASGVHNVQVGDNPASPYVQEGETIVYTFVAPQSGSVQYWCVPHKGAGMLGTVRVATAGGDGGAGGGDVDTGVTGEAIDLGTIQPGCEGVMIPAVVTRGIVGGPTVQDYVDACLSGEVQEADDTHPADYVIPVSWALIGLGVVAVVWVHKYYKP